MMAAREDKRTAREGLEAWACAHPTTACVALASICTVALVMLFVFGVFWDSSGSADFIYSRF